MVNSIPSTSLICWFICPLRISFRHRGEVLQRHNALNFIITPEDEAWYRCRAFMILEKYSWVPILGGATT